MLINILTLFQSCIIIFMEENMGSYKYKVIKIEGDYATLIRTDISTEETMFIALALLPFGTDLGTELLWENLTSPSLSFVIFSYILTSFLMKTGKL